MDISSDDEIKEQLMNMTIREINEKRLISKRWRKLIDSDSFWCRLLERDYNILPSEHLYENCKIKYMNNHKMINYDINNAYDIIRDKNDIGENIANYLIEFNIILNIDVVEAFRQAIDTFYGDMYTEHGEHGEEGITVDYGFDEYSKYSSLYEHIKYKNKKMFNIVFNSMISTEHDVINTFLNFVHNYDPKNYDKYSVIMEKFLK
jgi:hypothetical protein